MPQVDRGGSRESKVHDRRTKRGNLAKANPFENKQNEFAIPDLTHSPPPHSLNPISSSQIPLIDALCNITSRQLAKEQNRMLDRAISSGVHCIICHCTDWEKVIELRDIVNNYRGFLFASFGLHPDNVKRNNDKLFQQNMLQLKGNIINIIGKVKFLFI
jgi:hypothetical protein